MKYGQIVKVVNPEFLVRCGYPSTIENAKNKLSEVFKEKNKRTISKFLGQSFTSLKEDDIDKIINIVARSYNKNVLHFGGVERKIYKDVIGQYEGKKFRIISNKPKIHKTGIYQCGHTTCYHDEDYEPPYLSNI